MKTLLQYQGCNRTEHSVLCGLRGRILCAWLLLALYPAPAPLLADASPTERSPGEHSSNVPLVALASSFRTLWPDLMDAYLEETGNAAARTSFASSGLLTTQIRHGAPFELFLSADKASVQQLDELGRTQGQSATLAYGTLCLVRLASTAPAESVSAPLEELSQRIERSDSFKLAIPNPQHAPYGVAARQALEQAGAWPLPAGTLLNAENAAQTLQYVLSGAVDFAIVPLTLVVQPPDKLHVTRLTPSGYEPVVHEMALLTPAGDAAEALFHWLQGESAGELLGRYGLTPAR